MYKSERKNSAREMLLFGGLLLGLFCLSLVEAVSAEMWAAGVAIGDFVYYEMHGVYSSSDPNVVVEVPTFERNNTEWVRVEFAGLSGSVVHQVYTLRFRDGTETMFEFRTDLAPGNPSNFTEKGVPLCAANLNVGDPLPAVKLTINDTFTMVYPTGKREINHVSWNTTDDWGDCYFDKKTGVLIELCRVHKFASKTGGIIVEKADIVKMTRTSLWEAREPQTASPPPMLTMLLTAMLLLAAITKHKSNSRKRTT
ncbi:MAG: hypothetical protein NWE95_09540 [Candidatus Bathyarchaeota archaeon]|nr:hypothetical protein [Candidatus Bathyarchaeota archaeon]